jgi:APA family basic amino acid/polyamine antiporter
MVEHTRSLGFRVAFAIGLGTMIAAGIFSLSGIAVAQVGSSAVISFLIAAVVAGLTAASYSEFASIYSENGGGYLFSSRTFENQYLLYAEGISLFLGYTGTTAFYLGTMSEWVQRFVIPPSIHIPHGTSAVLVALLLGILNARGTEESGTFQVFVTGAKVAVLLAFIGGAFAYKPPTATITTFTGAFSTDIIGILSIASLAFITFFGFSAIAASAGEIIKPRETVPKAIGASILVVTILYIFVIVAMVNSPVPASVVAKYGETAMGRVAASFLGSFGKNLIVAGAIFSMVSASNASILAATGIGNLMGRQGQAPRRFSRIHPDYGTPFWSIATVTFTIITLIVTFIVVFPAEHGFLGIDLGLTGLNGFATLNLLAPLSVVNVALIYSRRNFPDLDRPLEVPFTPVVPILGILANVALITTLPRIGVYIGIGVEIVLVIAYLAWGGKPDIEELFEPVVAPRSPLANGNGVNETQTEEPEGQFRVLVPVARPVNAPKLARLATMLGNAYSDDPVLRIVNVTQRPEQTPSESVVEVAEKRANALTEALSDTDISAQYSIEGHIATDVGFDIVQTARNNDANMIVVGYPEEHQEITEKVEYDAPCDVFFADGLTDSTDLSTVNVGAGGGPHHQALLPLINSLADLGSQIHIINVDPGESGGTSEEPGDTLDALSAAVSVQVHRVTSESIAEGLVSTAKENGGILFIGASRTRFLRRWVFGGTPDRVIELADDADVPVIIYTSPIDVASRIEEALFPLYRYLKGLTSTRTTGSTRSGPQNNNH